MLVLINPTAGGGRAGEKWRRVEPAVRGLAVGQRPVAGPFRVEVAASRAEVATRVASAIDRGERTFIAGGGDGTVNRVLSALASRTPHAMLPEIRLGGVGLGSSNDFHKPFADRRVVRGVPLRVDAIRSGPHDVGRLEYRIPGRDPADAWWIVNASIGVTADANAFFNGDDALLAILKRRWVGGAITYAALRTLLTSSGRTLGLRLDGAPERWDDIATLGVTKNPHFAGSLRYGNAPAPDSGTFGVHVLENAARRRLLAALVRLARGRFDGTSGAASTTASKLGVRSGEPFPLEFDGEVVTAEEASFTLLSQRIQLCA